MFQPPAAALTITNDDEVDPVARRAADGDSDALGQLYRYFSKRVRSYLLDLTRDTDLAEDLAHDTWVKITRSIPGWVAAPEGGFGPWLFRVARNTWTDRLRYTARRPELLRGEDDLETPDTAETPEEVAEWVSVRDEFWTRVRMLPPAQAEVLTLRFRHGMSEEETAERLGKSRGAVRKAQHDGIAGMRRRCTPEQYASLVS